MTILPQTQIFTNILNYKGEVVIFINLESLVSPSFFQKIVSWLILALLSSFITSIEKPILLVVKSSCCLHFYLDFFYVPIFISR